MNPKKAFIGIFLLSFIFLSFSTVGADELQEFLDSTQITVTVNQSQSQVDFSLDTSGRTWDTQSVNIRDVIIGDITINEISFSFDISKFLNDINAEVEIEEGSNRVHFNELSILNGIGHVSTVMDITTPSNNFTLSLSGQNTRGFLNTTFNNLYSQGVIDESIDINDINSVNNYLSGHPIETSPSHITFTKQGTEYIIWNNDGYGDVREEWKAEIREIINESVQQINIESILSSFLPMLESEPEFQAIWGDLNLDFNVTDMDLSPLDLNASFSNLTAIQLEDGNYTIPVTVTDGSATYTKNVLLVIQGIQNTDTGGSVVNGIYTPANEEVKHYLIGISGLGSNTISVSLFDVFSSTLPSNVKSVIKYMEISSSAPGGTIEFKVPVTDVSNPARVGLYVFNTGTNAWEGLSTNLTSTSGGFYYYSAFTPHFSTFMIMETLPSSDGGSSRRSSGGDDYQFGSAPSQPIAPSAPEPIEATPAPGAEFNFFRMLGGVIGAPDSEVAGLVVLIFILVGIIALVLVIRNVPGRKGKKQKREKINEKSDEDER